MISQRSGIFPKGPDAGLEAANTLICREIAERVGHVSSPFLMALCGPQGSGKSWTAARIEQQLRASGMHVATRSLDDFYLTKSERSALGKQVHPLLVTRGVPGTHDLGLLARTLDRLSAMAPGDAIPLPTFDKPSDDRMPDSEWPLFRGRPDVIILEGWCMGARPQPARCLRDPINELERDEDQGAVWRTYVNDRLAGDYAALFRRIDLQVMLKAPSFDCVFDWRAEQEAKLDRPADGSRPAMDAQALRRFIAHYERLTRWLMADEPADLVIEIDPARTPIRWRRTGGN